MRHASSGCDVTISRSLDELAAAAEDAGWDYLVADVGEYDVEALCCKPGTEKLERLAMEM